jgi:hypothetical protein
MTDIVRLDRGLYQIEGMKDAPAWVWIRGKRADKDVELMINDLLAGIRLVRNIWLVVGLICGAIIARLI